MHPTLSHILAGFGFPATLLLSGGCVSARYKLAPTDTPPPITLNLPAAQAPVEAILNTVIVYRGPGSWKREAFWDEYVLTVANRGAKALVVESAQLTGLGAKAFAGGSTPWTLEEKSRRLRDDGFGLARDVAVQIGGGVATVAAGAAAGAGAFTLVYGSAWGAGAAGATLVGAVALPAFIGGSIYANVSSRKEVEREFRRRELALPATLVPNQVVQGSAYFPITPGPQRLVLRGRAGGDPFELTIPLDSLGSLHLKVPGSTRAIVSQP